MGGVQALVTDRALCTLIRGQIPNRRGFRYDDWPGVGPCRGHVTSCRRDASSFAPPRRPAPAWRWPPMRRGARTPRFWSTISTPSSMPRRSIAWWRSTSEAALAAALAAARTAGKPVCVAGGRHAMGGQQFAEGAVLIDTRPMGRILGLDAERGVVEVEAGIQWPELIHGLIAMQPASEPHRTHTGASPRSRPAPTGSRSAARSRANIHGRGLALRPIVGEVEAFNLMNADGELLTCSRPRTASSSASSSAATACSASSLAYAPADAARPRSSAWCGSSIPTI